MKIEKNKIVAIEYVLKDTDGKVLDSSHEAGAFEYLHGRGNLIVGLEKQLEGREPGDKFSAVIEPAEAYGEYMPEGVRSVSKDMFNIDGKFDHEHIFEGAIVPLQDNEGHHGGFSSLLNRGSHAPRDSGFGHTTLYNYNQRSFQNSRFFQLIQNPIIMIILVVAIAYILSFICGNLLRLDAGITGLIEMLTALILSYGLSLYSERNGDFIVRGTFIFFISLVILIILIFV